MGMRSTSGAGWSENKERGETDVIYHLQAGPTCLSVYVSISIHLNAPAWQNHLAKLLWGALNSFAKMKELKIRRFYS
jgi:hypothetical protein